MNDYEDEQYYMVIRSGDNDGIDDHWDRGLFRTRQGTFILSQGNKYVMAMTTLSLNFHPLNITSDFYFSYISAGQRGTIPLTEVPIFVDTIENLLALIRQNIPDDGFQNLFKIDYDSVRDRVRVQVQEIEVLEDGDWKKKTDIVIVASDKLNALLGMPAGVEFKSDEHVWIYGNRPPNLFIDLETIYVLCPSLCESSMLGSEPRPLLATVPIRLSTIKRDAFRLHVKLSDKHVVPVLQNSFSSLTIEFVDCKGRAIGFATESMGICTLELLFEKQSAQFL